MKTFYLLSYSNSCLIFKQEISPGGVDTDILIAGGYVKPGEKVSNEDLKLLRSSDISQGVIFLLTTPYNVNITEIVIKPVGETV